MKTFRTIINIVLGAVVTFLLPGCKASKQASRPISEDAQAIEKIAPEDRIICLYGIPPEVYRQLHNDSSSTDSTGNGTTATE